MKKLAYGAGVILVLFGVITYVGYRYLLDHFPTVGYIGQVLSGGRLSAQEAEELEKEVEKDPDDSTSRSKLLGYYFLKQTESDAIRKSRDAHILWFIKNQPESAIAGTPYAEIDSVSDPGFEEAKQLWLDQVQKNPNNATILENAANFFTLPDKTDCETLLIKGAQLEPSNQKWLNKLAHLYSLQKDYGKAFEQYEKAYGLSSTEMEKLTNLPNLAKTGVEAGELDKAKRYAEELLTLAESSQLNWNRVEDLHDGNMVLGRVALRAGDTEGAKQYLIKAGEAPGKERYSAFGPNMSLAKDLLEKGETQTVLRYFELCSNFWNNKTQLDAWTADVQAGRVPDFRGNLDY